MTHKNIVTMAILTAALAACSGEADGVSPELLSALNAKNQDCLIAIWDTQSAPDKNFDREHDGIEGGTISCATDTSPSQFAGAIEAIRLAADSDDRKAMIDMIGIPLVYLDAEGNRREITANSDIERMYDDIFSRDLVATMSGLTMQDMAVKNRTGGYFELGAVWLAAPQKGARPRIVTINHQALSEAAAARDNRPV
ncbi:hypothetical protein BPTFM16_01246 [Altererythrobacter insulae]|nr:hypothetical protein BPTFM16_01246 [Altererythrobacter insulae]